MSRIELDETARCACGAVTLEANGQVRSMLLCTCLDCRKATGTGHSAVTLMKRTDVTVSGPTKGFARTANSGATVTRHFCPDCGTPLFARTTRAPDLILIATGIFDDPHWFAPARAIFARSHLDWDILPPDLPRHETYPNAQSP